MTPSADIVVVGCGVAAGYFCRELVESLNKWSVTVIGNEPHLPYERPALTKGYLVKGGFPVSNFHTCVGSGGNNLDAEYYKNNNIKFILNSNVDKIDVKSKEVHLSNDTTISAGKVLVLAMGSRPTTLEDFKMPLSHVKTGIHYIRDVEDTDKVIKHSKDLPKESNVVIMGGGYIGMETSAGLIGYGHQITMVFPEEKVMDRFMTKEIADFYEGRYKTAGINIVKGDLVTSVVANDDGSVKGVTLKSGITMLCDLLVVGVGARPNVDLVKGQLDLLERAPGGVIVNSDMEASVEGTYVIGELAANKDANGDVNRYEHVHYARLVAMQAAKKIARLSLGQVDASSSSDAFRYSPYFYSRIMNLGWVLYGETPQAGVEVCYVGDLSNEGNGRFAAFWVSNDTKKVVGGFLEGGSPDEVNELRAIVSEGRVWPLSESLLKEGSSIN